MKRVSLAAISAFSLGASSFGSVSTAQTPLAGGSEESSFVVEVARFIGTIEIKRGTRLDYSYEPGTVGFDQPKANVTTNELRLDGGHRSGPNQCRQNNNRLRFRMEGGKLKPSQDFPRLTVTVPDDVSVVVELLGGQADLGDIGALDVSLNGCGRVDFGSVLRTANINLKGSGDIEGDTASSAKIKLDGSGDISLDYVSGDVSADLTGSGDIVVERMSGSLDAKLRGSGDITVDEGDLKDIAADLTGSGDISFNGSAETVSVLLKGSGDVYVARSTGNVSVSRSGSGDVRIADRRYQDD